jgi:hypothetical protein
LRFVRAATLKTEQQEVRFADAAAVARVLCGFEQLCAVGNETRQRFGFAVALPF